MKKRAAVVFSLSPQLGEGWELQKALAFSKAFLALLVFFLLGCRSAAPPKPPPVAVNMAERAEEQAVKLSSQQQNWPAAARAWQLAADRFSLLNDVAGEAVALHNLSQAERALGQQEQARKHLEQAAGLNQETKRTNEWWRNQIALLQLEADSRDTNALKTRFEELLPLAGLLRDRFIQGLFQNELGLWEMIQGEFAKAEGSFAEAEQNLRSVNDSAALVAIDANRAELYESEKKFPAALAAWKAALVKFEALADPPGIARALAGQGRTLLAAGENLATAEKLLRRAAHNYQILHEAEPARFTLELLARCLTAEGKSKEAESVRQELQRGQN